MAQADEIICRKKLYLDRNFTKEDLAVQLGTNRTYLGAAMSFCRRGKWCDYINSFRLKCFMEEVCLKDTRTSACRNLPKDADSVPTTHSTIPSRKNTESRLLPTRKTCRHP